MGNMRVHGNRLAAAALRPQIKCKAPFQRGVSSKHICNVDLASARQECVVRNNLQERPLHPLSFPGCPLAAAFARQPSIPHPPEGLMGARVILTCKGLMGSQALYASASAQA